MLITIIIPIYNSEKYLEECLNSIINQNYKELEIILINDGSTDKSKNIAESFVLRDNRVRLLNKENGGQASARNLGLDNATGDYIAFVDSDDTISFDVFSTNIVFFEKDQSLDVIQFPVFYNYGSPSEKLRQQNASLISDKDELLDKWIVKNKISWLVCDKLFKKNIFDELRFPTGMIYEDNFLIIEALMKINKIYISDSGVYYYYLRNDSTTNSKYSLKKDLDTQKVNLFALQTLSKMQVSQNLKIIFIAKIFNIYQSINYNFNKYLILDELFLSEFRKITILDLIKSSLSKVQMIKLILVKIFGIKFYLKLL